MFLILEVNNLSKSFGGLNAVRQLHFSIEEGMFYSLLGPNGAGKSTTIHILSTLFPYDEGSVTIGGYTLGKENEKIKSVLGVVPQEISLYEDLTALENLFFWGKMYKVPQSVLKARIEEKLRDFGLFDRKNDKIKTYSGGMKRRINIAAALLHEPRIVFMDEPTVGIDPQSRNNIYEALQQMKSKGITILYTTHYMEEAERFSDRVGIIDNGSVIAEGSVRELKKIAGTKEEIAIHVVSINDAKINSLKEKYRNAFSVHKNELRIETEDAKKELIPTLNFCNQLQLEIEQVEMHKANLEKVFLMLTGKKLRD